MNRLFCLALLFISFVSFSQITNYRPYQPITYHVQETVPIKNYGYFRYWVNLSDKEKTFLTVNFFSGTEGSYTHKLPLPKMEFLGYASEGTQALFMFFDYNNRAVNYVIFHDNGKSVTYERKKINNVLKNCIIFHSTDDGFYTSKKASGKFIITKISFKTDTLWTKVFDEKKATYDLLNALNYKEKLFLNINANRIVCIDDKSGKTNYDRSLNGSPKVRQNFKFLIDKEKDELVLAGEEFAHRKEKHAEAIYLMRLDSFGEISYDSYFPMPKIHFKSMNSKEGVFIRDILKVDTAYVLVGESINKTTGNIAAGYIVGGVVMALTGVLVAPNTEVSYVTGIDISILKPNVETKSLEVFSLDKELVEKFYPQPLPVAYHEFHGLLNSMKAFDYQFSIDRPDGKRDLIYFHSVSEQGITLAKGTYSNRVDLEIKKLLLRANMKEVRQFKMYQLSYDEVLMELQTDKILSFHIVKLSSFR